MNKGLWPLLGLLFTAPVPALTEQEAVLFALNKSPDIRILSFGLSGDSLAERQIESETGLRLVLSGDRLIEVHPRTALDWNSGDTTERTLASAGAVTASKKLPGGGELLASAANTINEDLDTKRADHAVRYALAISQPLLQGAFGKSDAEYRIRVGRLGLRKSAETFRGELERLVAETRKAYWNWVLASETARIRENETSAAESERAFARARFKLGETSEIDTLSAALEALRAHERAMTARADEAASRETLALLTGLSPDSVALPDRPAEPALNAPSLTELSEAAVQNDAALRVLVLNAEALEAERARARNALLPRLDLEAGVAADRFGTRFLAGNRATSFLPNSTDPYAGLRVSFDLLNRKERLARAASEVKLAANAAEREKALLVLQSQLRGLFRTWGEDTARLALRDAEIRIAEKRYAQSQKAYELGALDNLALIKARDDLYGARLNLLNTRLSLKKTEIALDRAAGKSLNKFGVTLK